MNIRGKTYGSLRSDPFLVACSLVGGTLVVFVLLALAALIAPEFADLPHLMRIAGESDVISAILITFGGGLAAVIVLMILGTPLAYVLARTDFRGKHLVESLVDLPLVLPHTVAGLMVYILFMQRGLIGAPFAAAGVVFEDAIPGIIVAMLFVAMPFYVNTVREGFEKVPVHMENTARTLGATRFEAFRTVTIPCCTGHIANGASLAWGRAIGEFAAIVFIAYFPMVISTLIYFRFSTGGLAESRSIACVIIVASLVIFISMRLLVRRGGGHDRV